MFMSLSATEIADLPQDMFMALWIKIVGEVPAAIVERPVMVSLLVETAAARERSADPGQRNERVGS